MFDKPAANVMNELPTDWPDRLDRAKSLLLDVSGATEAEFLATGANLHDFFTRANQIAQMSTAMAGLVSGGDISQTIQRLHEIIARMNEYLVCEERETEQSSRALSSILTLLEKTATPLSGFGKINKSLRMLGISTKIESARLGQSAAGFETLANDVAQLSIQVLEKAGTILEQKELLGEVIRRTLNQVVTQGTKQRGQVKAILEKTQVSLEALTNVNVRCSSAASAIAGTSEEVSGRMEEVIMSMQFHDIVRQQMEHVAEALDDLTGMLKRDDSGDTQARAQNTAVVCELQAAQLSHACDELKGAVGRIVDNLCGIGQQEACLSEEIGTMAGIADETGSSFLTKMQTDLTLVGTVLSQSAEIDQSLATAMNTVSETVAEITRFVSDIEFIGEEIELIALNSQVKAALTGDEGAALGVLAEAIQRLSVDAIAQTSTVSKMLTEVTTATQELCDSAREDASELGTQVCDMVASLPGLLESLYGVNNSLAASLTEIRQVVQSLCADIETATLGITAHHTVTGVAEEVMTELKAIIQQARLIAPSGVTGAHENLVQLSDRYTMHSERRIHESLINKGGSLPADSLPTPTVAMPLAGSEGSGDLGDNVELF